MPDLKSLLIGDDPKAWADAGFVVDEGYTSLGSITVGLGGDHRRIEMELSEWTPVDPARLDIDGLPARSVARQAPTAGPDQPAHPNGVIRLDHVVITTPDLPRTVASLEAARFEVRRTRDVPGQGPARQQVFLWAGETILEVIGPIESTNDEPASIWGLALTTENLDRAAEVLGPNLSSSKPAVQPGRRIATVNTANLGITPALALMSPHVRPNPTREQPDTPADYPGSDDLEDPPAMNQL